MVDAFDLVLTVFILVMLLVWFLARRRHWVDSEGGC